MKLSFESAHKTRSVFWFGPIDYIYGSGNSRTELKKCPIETHKTINELGKKLGRTVRKGITFNSCLVNFYENETKMVPKHSDDEVIFDVDPVIASLSFGAARRFIIEPKNDENSLKRYNDSQFLKSIKSRYVFCLSDGDLIVMSGSMQRYWNHSVPPETLTCGPRINLTFRSVRDSS